MLAVVTNAFKGTNTGQVLIDGLEWSMPEVIGDRTALIRGCWEQQCSAFRYIREHRERKRDHEVEPLARYDRLARYLESQVGLEARTHQNPVTSTTRL